MERKPFPMAILQEGNPLFHRMGTYPPEYECNPELEAIWRGKRTMQPYYQDDKGIVLYHGDCLDVMPTLEGCPFDAVICDPPYGTTACAWDSVIPFDAMWLNLKRLVKRHAPVVLFGSQPFTSALVMSNPKWFRHEWIWKKNKGSNFAMTDRAPFKEHENIILFSDGVCAFNPQMQKRSEAGASRVKYQYSNASIPNTEVYRKFDKVRNYTGELRFPSSVQEIDTCTMGLHPTAKPLALIEYLIRTYTNEGDLILDFTCGSGTTLRAAKNLKRRCVGIERDLHYCETTVKRLEPEFEQALVDNTTDFSDLPLFAA